MVRRMLVKVAAHATIILLLTCQSKAGVLFNPEPHPRLHLTSGVTASERSLTEWPPLQSSAQQGTGFPPNITGTYKGTWHKEALSKALQELLQKEEGMLIYQLKTSPSDHEGIHDVEGELVVRDGVYVTEEDLIMKLRGAYVLDVGRLHAVLEPSVSLQVDLEEHESEEQGAAYRQALREVAQEWAMPGVQPMRFAGKPMQQLQLQKRCSFKLELVVGFADGSEQAGWTQQQQGLAAHRASSGTDDQARLEATKGYDSTGAARDLNMNGTLSSSNCATSLQINATTTHIEAYYAKAVNYTLMITAISFFQVLLLIRQMEATSNPVAASKISLLTIGQQAIMDAYLCLLHLTTGIMVEPLFNAFATAAFFKFVIFAIFEMRYLLSIWRARRASVLDPWAAQQELSILYARFYGALLGGILLTYQLQRFMRYMLFGLYSFWIPQIVFCMRHDSRQLLRPAYVIGISITRLALPLYLHGCPKNLLRIPPCPWLCFALVAFVAAQVAILLLQHAFGPRCFVPKAFLPAKYEYFRAVTPRQLAGELGPGDVETGDGSVECVICMNQVEVQRASARMVTPCNHFFHPHCLQRWMDVKMECPTCRRSLPPP